MHRIFPLQTALGCRRYTGLTIQHEGKSVIFRKLSSAENKPSVCSKMHCPSVVRKNPPRPRRHNESPSRVSSSVIFPLIVEGDSPSSNCAAENPPLVTTALNTLSWLISTSDILGKGYFIKFKFFNVKILTSLFTNLNITARIKINISAAGARSVNRSKTNLRQLDHCFLSSILAPRGRSVMARNDEIASDHHPLWIDIDLESPLTS